MTRLRTCFQIAGPSSMKLLSVAEEKQPMGFPDSVSSPFLSSSVRLRICSPMATPMCVDELVLKTPYGRFWMGKSDVSVVGMNDNGMIFCL